MVDDQTSRPKRVVVVDADNPLVEVQGEFFWREDHEAIVAAARDEAYRAGFQAGSAQVAPRHVSFTMRHRLSMVQRLKWSALLAIFVAWVAFFVVEAVAH